MDEEDSEGWIRCMSIPIPDGMTAGERELRM